MNNKPIFLFGIRFSIGSLLLFSMPLTADVIYAGYSQNEASSIVGPLELDFKPAGLNLLASFNINDNWSIAVDLGRQDDSSTVSNMVEADYDSDSIGASLTYFVENWGFTYRYSQWEDELQVTARFRNGFPDIPVQTQENDAPSHALRATRYFSGANWQIGLSGGLHYNDWKQETVSLVMDEPGTIIEATESGDSTFLSAGIDAAWFFSLSDSRSLIAGASVNWNEHLSDDLDGIAIRGRSFNQFGNRNFVNNPNNLSVAGSQSYGQASLYVSFDISNDWLLDISTGSDFSLDDNNQYWNINLGYLF